MNVYLDCGTGWVFKAQYPRTIGGSKKAIDLAQRLKHRVGIIRTGVAISKVGMLEFK